MLHSSSFRQLRNPEFIQQGKDLALVIATTNPTNLLVKKQYDAFNTKVLALDDGFKLSQKNPLTQILLEIDAKRDDIFMGMCFIMDGHFKSWLPDIKAHAKLLIDSVAVYGRDLVDANYQAETASLNSLINKWETTPNLAAAITALNLTAWQAELKATNTLYATTYTDRAVADGSTDALPKMKTLRADVIAAWAKFQKVLVGKMEEYEDDAVKAPLYIALENSINGVLDKYNLLLTQRQAKTATSASPTPVTGN
jgi:hypothetical protein